MTTTTTITTMTTKVLTLMEEIRDFHKRPLYESLLSDYGPIEGDEGPNRGDQTVVDRPGPEPPRPVPDNCESKKTTV